MHRFGHRRARLVLIVAALVAFSAGPVAAVTPIPVAVPGSPVDPSTLVPEPPPGATCTAVDAISTICNTFKDFPLNREPVFNIACGKVYETSTDHRDALRWYVHGKAVRRFVHGRISGTWSLSPAATGKKVRITADWSSWTVWPVHGNDDTAQETFYGLQFRATATGLGNSILWFGRVDPDGSSHGIKNGFKGAEPPGKSTGVDAADLNAAALRALATVLC